MRHLLPALLALALALEPARAAGPLTVDGRWLRDDTGRVVFLHGVNYSQRGKSAPYTDWQSPEHFRQIAAFGFNSVRHIVQWAAIEPAPGRIDHAYLDRVEAAVGWAADAGLYVLIDMHQDVWSSAFGGNGAPAWATVDDLVEPNQILSPWWKTYFTKEVLASFGKFWTDPGLQDHYASAYRALAARMKKHPNVIGYDLMNEPFPGKRLPWTFEAGALTQFHARVTAAIRREHPGAVVFFEPVAMTANEALPTAVKPPPAPAVYAPHYYDFLLMLGKPYKNRKWLTFHALRFMEKHAKARGVPILFGELGCDRTDVGGAEAMADQCDAIDLVLGAGWMAWEFTPDSGPTGPLHQGGFSLVQKGVEHPALASFVRPYARAVAGTPRAQQWDRAARTFRLEYTATGTGRETIVHVPRRHFPSVTIEATGQASHDAASETVTHRPDPAVTVQKLFIRAAR